ncbi:hypothetical protein [Candidatus Parabeggiatoa sp. HSG14]|uniref:hypothetical protein n=1 Tax=Candidatus Parabeggiatoa sp. HSG14 TaxID=3055593 RepID=UPI0025A698A9|nr:hypothetical protein [Thiotrichales bacterium HSG14]
MVFIKGENFLALENRKTTIMKYAIKNFTIIIVILLSVQKSIAQEILVIPNTFFSKRNFEYSVFNGNVSGYINSLGGGITGIYQRFYIDLSGERNFSTNEQSIINGLSNTIEFERTDFAASLGYAVNDSISTFGGYKYGKSTLTELAFSPLAGGKTSLEGKGIFIGAGGGWVVKDWGTFSFSAAFAKMVANYQDLFVGNTKGKASGTSLGIEWKAPFTNHLSYELSIIRHDYYYEDFSELDSDISEQILSFRIGLSYRF